MLFREKKLIMIGLFSSMLILCVTFLPHPAAAKEEENPYKQFTNTLKTKDILPDTLKSRLKGEHYEVDNSVTNIAGMNIFSIQSQFGEMTVDGNYLLNKRIDEFPAIAQLADISRGEAFVESQVDATMASVDATTKAVLNPVDTISKLPQGFLRVFTTAVDDAKEIGKVVTGDTDAQAAVGEGVGASSAIRGIAKDYGVDPYTRNEILQKEMNRLAWFMATGKKAQEYTEQLVQKSEEKEESQNRYQELYTLTLPKLAEHNKQALQSIGLQEDAYSSLLENSNYIASELYFLAKAFVSLNKVKNIAQLSEVAGQAQTVDEAIFYYRSIEMLSLLHTQKGGIQEIAIINLVPAALMQDKRLIVVTSVDHALLYDSNRKEIDEFIKNTKEISSSGVEIWIEGTVPDEVTKELSEKDVTIVTLAFDQFK